ILNPVHEDALYYLGNTFLRAGLLDSARKRWEDLIGVNPQSERAYYQMGNLFFCVSHPDFFHPGKAVAYFQRASELNRESMNPGVRLGEIALFQNRLPEAFGIISKIPDQKNAELFFVKGYLNWKLGHQKMAIMEIGKTLELKGLKIAYDEGGKAVLSKKGSSGYSQECSLYQFWIDHDLILPPQKDSVKMTADIYRSFDQYLSSRRTQLNAQ
ncbi:MAG: hypothetical protein KGM98_14440, partial [Bacteroidota bacterium]|nr:hypothetical protein [Bacteroidota bacterium]